MILDRAVFRIAPEVVAPEKDFAALLQGDPVYDPAELFARQAMP